MYVSRLSAIMQPRKLPLTQDKTEGQGKHKFVQKMQQPLNWIINAVNTFYTFTASRWMCIEEVISYVLHCAFQPSTRDTSASKKLVRTLNKTWQKDTGNFRSVHGSDFFGVGLTRPDIGRVIVMSTRNRPIGWSGSIRSPDIRVRSGFGFTRIIWALESKTYFWTIH